MFHSRLLLWHPVCFAFLNFRYFTQETNSLLNSRRFQERFFAHFLASWGIFIQRLLAHPSVSLPIF